MDAVASKPAIDAVETGAIQFVPKQWENTFCPDADIQDWCISRQLWWGHRIPAWYDPEGNVYVGKSEEQIRQTHQLSADVELAQDEDVLIPGSHPHCGPLTLGLRITLT